MFYSETLLARNGPLARVWLASNMERKLSKQNVLSEKLETKVKDIIGEGQAPMALRMSGHLLLGVVRIYSRKARYLLDDCNEALVKIKLAFRPGNVDLPVNQSNAATRDALILPDTITELDLFAALPDPEELLREPDSSRGRGRDPTLLDFGTSQLLPETQTPSRREDRTLLLDDDDLGLDFGLEPGDRSIEIGRRASSARLDQPSMLLDDDLGLDLGLDGGDSTLRHEEPIVGMEDDFQMGGFDDDDVAGRNAAALARASAAADEARKRDSISPLSDLHPSVELELEQTFHLSMHQEDEDETMVQAAQRVKRRKIIKQDNDTVLHNSQIKKQQEDRSGITKAPSFLPRDPLLLQLMEMQRRGDFVSNIMGDGRMQGWAPELRGILSLEIVRKVGEKKRKRDSGIADVETDDERQLRLEIPQDEDEEPPADGGAGDFGADATLVSDGAGLPVMSDGQQPPADDERQPGLDEEDYGPSPGVAFDVTEAPLLHPSQSGPVSLGTKQAVHLLRELFAPDHPTTSTEPPTPSKRVKSEAMFTDLCPEKRTAKADVTKMFFELLVLGTKDAIKVEQDGKELGGPIRIRGKRGLWGDWATKSAGGEIAEQEQILPGMQEIEAEA